MKVLAELDKKKLPRHLAIIMDGNGRWAKERGKVRTQGHKEGAMVLKKIIRAVFELPVPYLSLYAFSVDNWKREKTEVAFLMQLLKNFYKNDFQEIKNAGIRVFHSGVYTNFTPDIIEIFHKIEEETKNNDKAFLNLCVNYGGRVEITEAVKKIAQKVKKGELEPENITGETIEKHLFHPEIPPVDLLIRTSGELRISDFLLWQSAYAEFYFTKTLWPDFTEQELYQAILDFQNRERRFGGTK